VPAGGSVYKAPPPAPPGRLDSDSQKLSLHDEATFRLLHADCTFRGEDTSDDGCQEMIRLSCVLVFLPLLPALSFRSVY